MKKAIEVLNESIEELEDALASAHAMPASVLMLDESALVWEGEFLMIHRWQGDRLQRDELRRTSRKTRMEAVRIIDTLLVKALAETKTLL